MRKTISLMLVCLMLVTLFTGCGGKAPAQSSERAASTSEPASSSNAAENPPAENKAPEPTASDTSDGIYEEPGEELEDFYNAVNSAAGAFEGAANSYDTTDLELDPRGDLLAMTSDIVMMVQYDYIQPGDNAMEVGQVAKGDAEREKNGDVITFSRKKVMEEDGFGGTQKKGDIISEGGTLNTSANTLFYEAKTERDGALISRKVAECVILEDGTYLVQTIRKLNPINERATDRGIAWFGRFNNNELEIIKAYFEPDVNFTYDSIAGKADATPESMAEGYKKATKMVVKDGKVEMTKY